MIPSLWFVTDPGRVADPLTVIASLPPDCGVIYRSFGAADALAIAAALRQATRKRGQTLLIGADWRLARRVGADGVHLPQRLIHLAPRLRRARLDWLITAAAHDARALRRANLARVDAVLLSPVFPSRSASAVKILGPIRFEALARRSVASVIALGGVATDTAKRLQASCAAGLAAVDAFIV